MNISLSEYEQFKEAWEKGVYLGMRYGKAFYTHFKLQRLGDNEIADTLFSISDKQQACAFILYLINFSD